jgi:phenylalanyl-tRNA synthetase alpha subunit
LNEAYNSVLADELGKDILPRYKIIVNKATAEFDKDLIEIEKLLKKLQKIAKIMPQSIPDTIKELEKLINRIIQSWKKKIISDEQAQKLVTKLRPIKKLIDMPKNITDFMQAVTKKQLDTIN